MWNWCLMDCGCMWFIMMLSGCSWGERLWWIFLIVWRVWLVVVMENSLGLVMIMMWLLVVYVVWVSVFSDGVQLISMRLQLVLMEVSVFLSFYMLWMFGCGLLKLMVDGLLMSMLIVLGCIFVQLLEVIVWWMIFFFGFVRILVMLSCLVIWMFILVEMLDCGLRLMMSVWMFWVKVVEVNLSVMVVLLMFFLRELMLSMCMDIMLFFFRLGEYLVLFYVY